MNEGAMAGYFGAVIGVVIGWVLFTPDLIYAVFAIPTVMVVGGIAGYAIDRYGGRNVSQDGGEYG